MRSLFTVFKRNTFYLDKFFYTYVDDYLVFGSDT